eukprot:CAMPEP_0113591642 /NCGR_PEP_ID=MMETSP0015_2-20120614/37382_1 /TAXON_ID=2838 /ORGANISM="Odontella" /LENGTH=191 /DNA_ID=CAMNT_0000498045 /DNA_START=38 /DNA_END=613 /DNA_ORIENTATION=- /assembly_acc=CAM_ASM_000160
MKCAILASLIAGAAAFAPAQKAAASTALNADFSGEVGAQAPLGFFDPFGMTKRCDEDRFNQIRLVEVKHGRVAMLAVVGYLTTYAGVRFPGAEDIPAGFAAWGALPGMVWAQMIATWGMMEAANRDSTGLSTFPGDFRNGYDFGWDKQSDEWKRRKRSIEVNNGRAAMMGITGLMVHEMMGNVDVLLPLAK